MAAPAFNAFNACSIAAVVAASHEAQQQVYLQFSASTVKYFGANYLMGLIKLHEPRADLIVHLDHCTDIDLMQQCVDAGWRSIMADYSDEPIGVNIEKTNYVRERFPVGTVQIEAEVGAVLGEEDGHKANDTSMAKIADVKLFVDETQVELLAVGIGNAHGHYELHDTKVDFEHFVRLHNAVPNQGLVLHGATGLDLAKVRSLNDNGLKKVNISTALKDLYIAAFENVAASERRYKMTEYNREAISRMTASMVEIIEALRC